ncbi:5-formyltetrahydrofolate cyclo-ligase [Rhodococcus daqingensis]|uniref:5-formyltetrahydrofolate cyclo-ligase n=1 Tax=Rhodococcus daqingensis TaxID=2479363 RepID=A0ABW2RYR6_9NOCA
MTDAATKAQWRARVLAERRSRDAETRDAENRALAAAAADLGIALGPSATVCAYVPVGTEPGSTAILDALRPRVARILLPVAREPGPLHWAEYHGTDALVSAPFGLREPGEPHLPPTAIAAAAAILIPALAVDGRGVRLGRGAGFYDRTLDLADPAARLIAVIRDDEVVAELPDESHDIRVGWVLTPLGGLRALGIGS